MSAPFRLAPVFLFCVACAGSTLGSSSPEDSSQVEALDTGASASAGSGAGANLPPANLPDPNNQTGLASVGLEALPHALDITAETQPLIGTKEQATEYKYRSPLATESLYDASGEPQPEDVQTGAGGLSNPFFYSLMVSLSSCQPSWLKSGIRYVSTGENGTHTYLVRLWVPSPLEGAVIDANTELTEAYVPTDDSLLRSSTHGRLGAPGNILWPAIYEKALFKLLSAREAKIDRKLTPAPQLDLYAPGDAAAILTGKRYDKRFEKQVVDSSGRPVLDSNGKAFVEANWVEIDARIKSNDVVAFYWPRSNRLFDPRTGAFTDPSLASGNKLRWDAEKKGYVYVYADGKTVDLSGPLPFSLSKSTGELVSFRTFPSPGAASRAGVKIFSMPSVDLQMVWQGSFITSWDP